LVELSTRTPSGSTSNASSADERTGLGGEGSVPGPAEALGLGSEPPHEYGSTLAAPAILPRPTGWVGVAVVIVAALLVGFLLTAGMQIGRTMAHDHDVRRAQLIELISVRQDHVGALTEQLEQLRGQVAAIESDTAAGIPTLQRQLADMEAAAGLTMVAGPGLRVTLDDARRPCPTGRPDDCRIQDTDLQLLANELFAAGAEAVAINGERVIATTAIRNAGGTILVNYRVLVAPYIVEAVGHSEGLAASLQQSQLGEDFTIWRDAYGLAFSIEEASDLQVPAFSGSIRLRAAAAGEGAR
jgi:uncharacterized protein YlxW (UPF0749 family)